MTVWWIVLDGAGHDLVQQLLEQGSMPHLDSLARRGAIRSVAPSAPSCQTPPGLATLFTGASPQVHGVTGFFVPGGEGRTDPDSWRNGFAPGVLRRDPVWVDLLRAGHTAAFVHVPWVFDAGDTLLEGVRVAIEAFSQREEREAHAVLRRPGDTARLSEVEARLDPDGRVTLRHRDGTEQVIGDEWSVSVAPDNPGCWFRAVRLADATVVVRTGRWRTRVGGSNAELVAGVGRATEGFPFVGESLGALYRDGVLGPTLAQGGDGTAESVLLSAADLVTDAMARPLEAILKSPRRPELVVAYVPTTDDLGHELAVGPEMPGLLATLAAGYRKVDALIGRVLAHTEPNDTVLISADHGMAPVRRTFYPNNVLVAAGLATPHPDPQLGADPSSPVLFHVVGNGLLVAPGGPDALQSGMTALQEARDHDDRPFVVGWSDERGRPWRAEEPGHAYARFAPGVLPWVDVTPGLPVAGPGLRSAAHTVWNEDPALRAVLVAAGPPWVTAAARDVADNRDVAGLVRMALGVDRTRPPLRLAVFGHSGAGKSTFTDILQRWAESRGLMIERVKLAAPLYHLQQEFRTMAGVSVPPDIQDQRLMESIATHLRALNPRSLVQPVLDRVAASHADIVVNDDLRDPHVDAPALIEAGFVMVKVSARAAVRASRLSRRGDVSTSDASASGIDAIPVRHSLVNESGLDSFQHAVHRLLEELHDSHRS